MNRSNSRGINVHDSIAQPRSSGKMGLGNWAFACDRKRAASMLSLKDFEIAARGALPASLYGFVSGAAEDGNSARQNASAFDSYRFAPRVLVDVSQRTQQTTLFGRTYAAPFGIAPIGISALLAYRGDVVFAEAGRDAGIPALMSGFSITPMERVSAAGGEWFQAYLPGADSKIDDLVDRVKLAGFSTLVITVDIPVSANRENNVRAGFSTPLKPSLGLAWSGLVRPRWLIGTFGRTILNAGMPHFENLSAQRGAPLFSQTALRDTAGREHISWEQMARIRRRWQGPLVLKGILHPDDAKRARQIGVDGIIVSNHGGRQLDGAVAPLYALPGIVDAVGDMPVMLDGGIRRGGDVLKAVALGARMVFVGRPFIYAVAAFGRAGVDRAVELLRSEIDRNMALLGATSLEELKSKSVLLNEGAWR